MSYKDELKNSILTLDGISDLDEFELEFIDIVEMIFLRAINESKQVGISIESIVYEMLEGIECGLKELGKEEVEYFLDMSSKTLLDVLQRCAKRNISHKKKRIELAINIHQDTIDAEELYLKEGIESLKTYALDHNYNSFKEKISTLQESLKDIINDLND